MRLAPRQGQRRAGVPGHARAVLPGLAHWRVQRPARVYELFGEILSALNLFSLAFCCFLYVKVEDFTYIFLCSKQKVMYFADFDRV